MTCYNPLDKFYKSQIGAIKAKTKITFNVKGDFNCVFFIYHKDRETDLHRFPMFFSDGVYSVTLEFDTGLYFYSFDLCNGNFIGIGDDYNGIVTSEPKYFQLSVYDEDYSVPKWVEGGIIYQIFPDRFYAFDKNKCVENGKILHDKWGETPVYKPNEFGKIVNNDFFGGDLRGIAEKLPYIKSLGVNIIYLNPIFKAFSNHRYDTGNYFEIDPLLGTEDDFKFLIAQAEKFNIKIVLDGVFNHTGDDSLYFNKYGNYGLDGAFCNPNSKYRSWFKFINYPNEYESWWGITTLPAVDKNNSDFIEYIAGKGGVLEKYTSLGIGGWRLDVVDELPEKFVIAIRDAVKRIKSDAVIIGEVWEDASNKISYGVRRRYFQGKELDSVMNYPLKNAIMNFVKYNDVNNLSYVIKEQIDHYPSFVLNVLMNILSTHDTYRLLSALSDADTTKMTKDDMAAYVISGEEYKTTLFRLKIATLLQYTLYGVPSIYYGDEVGMQGFQDPLNRACFPWENINTEILSWYRFLAKIRKDYDVFADGNFVQLYASDGVFAYKRGNDYSEVMVVINVSQKNICIEFDGVLTDLISDKDYADKMEIFPNGFAVLVNYVK